MLRSTGTTLSLASLFKDSESVKSHLEGRFENTLIKTRDYEIKLITLMNHEGNSGAFYEVETHADEKVHKFQVMDTIEAFVDGYMMELKNVMPVTININEIPSGLCQWRKDKVVVNGIFTIVELQNLEEGFARGMVQKSELSQVNKYDFLTP